MIPGKTSFAVFWASLIYFRKDFWILLADNIGQLLPPHSALGDSKIKEHYLSRVVRKPDFCICENKDADQLRGNREADQRLCFCYIDSTIPLIPKSEISSLYPYSVIAQPGLCGTWSETRKTGFLTTRLI